MQILKCTLKIIIWFFYILSCFYIGNISAKTTIVYYCETKNGKQGYYDRPCQLDKTTKQTILSLQNYRKIYEQTNYTKTTCFKRDSKLQHCNNIEAKIILFQKLLNNSHKKATIIKLKRKLFKYQLFKKNNCNTTG
jgi:hypothetical protein